MKAKYIAIILTVLLFGSCVKKEKPLIPSPFKPVLELAITELIDSLRNKIGENKLVSIEFYNPERYEHLDCLIKVFLSDWYASSTIDAYTKINGTTIAIYNLKDDSFEMVNKNNITFFTDTIVGIKDTCVMVDISEKKFYSIYKKDSIKKISFDSDFPNLKLIRASKCLFKGETFKIPKEYWFYYDSLHAEENLKFYQKEVKYYRSGRRSR